MPPKGPIYGINGTRIEFGVYNAGGGVARQPAYVLCNGLEYVGGIVAQGTIGPRGAFRIVPELTPTTWGGDWHGRFRAPGIA